MFKKLWPGGELEVRALSPNHSKTAYPSLSKTFQGLKVGVHMSDTTHSPINSAPKSPDSLQTKLIACKL